ncbi:U3 small nucleolar RNA-associated protein 25 homolog [Culicoides brevitarsis]|uniref:U3 small nucleolar RNA-associated protein 25 homolog n=1 Tax=Culicoides brevitarsis TaxID=469753 RepID=UPI00307BB32B
MAPKNRKFFKKNYSKKPNKPKFKAKKYNPDKNKTKFKHIARNQEAEDVLKRMRNAELKREERQKRIEEDSEASEASDVEPDPFEQLLESISTKNGVNQKSQVSSDEDSSAEESENLDESEAEMDHEAQNEDPEDENEDFEEESDVEMGEEEVENEENASENENSGNEEQENDDARSESSEKSEKEEVETDVSDSEIEEYDEKTKSNETDDPFGIHLDNDLPEGLLDAVSSAEKNFQRTPVDWKCLGKLLFEIPQSKSVDKPRPKGLISLDDVEVFAKPGKVPEIIDESSSNHIKNQIWSNFGKANEVNLKEGDKNFTPLQKELFSIINNYQDIYFPQRNFNNAEEIRFIYSLHALNHAMKTRARVLHHNARLNKSAKDAAVPDFCRDQGLTRPKVLIVVPFRDSCYKIVNNFIALFCNNDKSKVMNHPRFESEFTGNELFFPKRNPKPEDYEKIFAGNVDDNFRLGMCFTKKNIKLYTDYYNSDIIIASPLGLRLTIGAPGEKDRDFDFLSSIEMLIMDQAEIFYAQNWEHVMHFLDHMHLKPEKMLNTDFSRVRSWILSGLSKYYCQTLLFTSHELPEFRSLYNNKMLNYRGKVRTINPVDVGSIRHVAVNVPQIFQRIEVSSLDQSFDERFNYFTKTVLPQFKTPTMAHCLVYVPSYFDYIRIRNYFKKEEVSFVQISEYSKDEKVARARDMFFHSSAHFLLYSERAHFFKRTRLKGIRNIIMYAPPAWPHFYAEILNLMHENYQNSRDGCENSMSVTLLYTKYDLMQVSAIVGTERATKMAKVGKTTHMFMND